MTLTITTSDLDSTTVHDPPIVEIDGMRHRNADQNRWHDMSLHRSAAISGPPLICHIQYHTRWDGEIDHDFLIRADDLDGLRQQLRNHGRGPLDYVRGFPPLPHYAERQANLMQWLRARFCDIGRDLIEAARDAGL